MRENKKGEVQGDLYFFLSHETTSLMNQKTVLTRHYLGALSLAQLPEL